MNKFAIKFFSNLVILAFLFTVATPVTIFAQKDTGIVYDCENETGKKPGECDYNDLIKAIKKAFNYATPIAVSFSVVIIAYVGYLYMISGDNSGKRKEANDKLQKVAIGIGFMLGAWLIVTLITNALLRSDIQQIVPLG